MTIAFVAMEEEPVPQLHAWLCEPHVARWWGGAPTREKADAEYRPGIGATTPTEYFIAVIDGRPSGMVQTYRWDAYPVEAGHMAALPGEAGLDYLIGEPGMIGAGIGPAMLGQFLRDVVFSDPAVTGVRTCVATENRRSWRCLEKLGFVKGEPRAIVGEDGPQYVLTGLCATTNVRRKPKTVP